MLNKLFRKKSITSKPDEKLNRCLTSFDLTLLGVGCIIGTGIFVLTGIAAANQAGPAVILSFLASGFACAFAALSYAELSSSVGGVVVPMAILMLLLVNLLHGLLGGYF